MDTSRIEEESTEQLVQRNIAKWQDVENPLAPLSEEQMDIIYHIEDTVQAMFYKQDAQKVSHNHYYTINNNNNIFLYSANQHGR